MFSFIVFLIVTGMSFSDGALAGGGKTETAISMPPDLSAGMNSEQESLSVCKYPFKKMKEAAIRISPFQSRSAERNTFGDYPWAMNPSACNHCRKRGGEGCFHRYRSWLESKGLKAIKVGTLVGLILTGADVMLTVFRGTFLNAFTIGRAIAEAQAIMGGVVWMTGTLLFPLHATVKRIYQCNHKECIEPFRLRDTDIIDEELRCPGDSRFLLNHPVVIRGYEHPLSLEFVMQCIRDKTPFPEGTSNAVNWNRIIMWYELSAPLQEQIKKLHAKSQRWLQMDKTLNMP